MNLKTFKKIEQQVAALEKADIKFDVSIANDNHWSPNTTDATFEPVHYELTTLRQLAALQMVIGRSIPLKDHYNKVTIAELATTNCVRPVAELQQEMKKSIADKFKYPTLKFFYDAAVNQVYDFDLQMISAAPPEQLEEEITYRFIGNATECWFCIPHDHPLYNYLDQGFFFSRLNKHNQKTSVILTDALTLDTYLVMLLVHQHNDFKKQLINEVYINSHQAKLLRIKFEKDLPANKKDVYNVVRDAVLKEYEKTANANLLQRVAEGKVTHATYNNIRFTKRSATYEIISIEAEDLMETLYNNVAFDDRTDIYSVIRDYVRYVYDKLEEEDLLATKTALTEPVPTGDAVADKKATDEYLKSLAEEVTAEYVITMNKIPITLKRTSENTRRYINGMMVNKVEVEEVVCQAACYTDEKEYNKFVKSVSKMSLKWHNALANGIPVKINDGLTEHDYKKAEAPTSSPRVKFEKDAKDFKLVVGEKESVKIKFNQCLTLLATLNRKTNNRHQTGAYGRRDQHWARRELNKVLKECCTFDKKVSETTEVDEPVLDAAGVQTVDAEGNQLFKKVKKTTVKVVQECLLTDDQAKFVGKMAEDFQKLAIEKSKKFLESAIKATGAQLVTFQGVEGYRVAGTLRNYFVNKATNQVANHDTGAHICIVEPGHQVSVGGDATAARLYALKNDSVLTAQIGTLKHG